MEIRSAEDKAGDLEDFLMMVKVVVARDEDAAEEASAVPATDCSVLNVITWAGSCISPHRGPQALPS